MIVEFNDLKINSVDHLRNTVSSSKPNKSYDLVVIRDGRKKRLKVVLEEDIVVVFGPDQNASEFAISAGTISYEVLSGIGPRVKRIIHS